MRGVACLVSLDDSGVVANAAPASLGEELSRGVCDTCGLFFFCFFFVFFVFVFLVQGFILTRDTGGRQGSHLRTQDSLKSAGCGYKD